LIFKETLFSPFPNSETKILPLIPLISCSGHFGVLPYIHRVGCRFTGEGGGFRPAEKKERGLREFEGNFFGGRPKSPRALIRRRTELIES